MTARLLEEVHDHTRLNSVPPPAVRRALEAADLAWPASGPEEIGALLARTFGVSGFLAGELLRYSERAGSARGSASPAAVAFTLGLYGADGRLIWRASFDESQQSLMDDPGSFRRAWDRGFRWLTAEQIAAYGAREVVGRLPDPGDAP